MTKRELSQYYWLCREIQADERRLRELRSRAESPRAASLSGTPGGGADGSATERIVSEMTDLEAIIAAKQIQCIHERQRIERYIADIPDSLTRMIFTFRFVDGMSWVKVAMRVGGGNTADGVKKRCYRYLKGES